MTIFSPAERTQTWRDAADAGPDDREFRLHVLAAAALDAVVSTLNLRGETTAARLSATFDVLDATGLLHRDDLRQTFAEIDDEPRSARAFLAELSSRMLAEALDPQLAEAHIELLLELGQQWQQAAAADAGADAEDDEVYLSVADVAAKYAVTRQAVYKWIRKGAVEARSRPGGSYQIPRSALDRLNRPA